MDTVGMVSGSEGELEEGQLVPKHRQIWYKQVPKMEAFRTGIDLLSNEERQKMEKRKARFGGDLEGEFEVKMVEHSYNDKQMEVRAARFGIQYQKDEIDLQNMKKMDLWEDHKQVDQNVERRQEAIYLYGVDLMSTGDVMKYFEEYGPSHVEWINDSSCTIVFGDPYSTTRALVGKGEVMSKPPNNYDQKKDLISHVWYKGKSFQKGDSSISLAYRMATVEDVADPENKKPSRYLWQLDHNPKYNKNFDQQEHNYNKHQSLHNRRTIKQQRSRQLPVNFNRRQMKKSRQNQTRSLKLKRYFEKMERQKQQQSSYYHDYDNENHDFTPQYQQQNNHQQIINNDENNVVVAPRRYLASVVLGLGPGTDDEAENKQDKQENIIDDNNNNKYDNNNSKQDDIGEVGASLMDMQIQSQKNGEEQQQQLLYQQQQQQEQLQNGQENMQIDEVQ